MAMEETLVLLKPDALERNLVRYVLSRFCTETNLGIVAAKVVKVDERLGRTHYNNLVEMVKTGEMDQEKFEHILNYIMGVSHDEARVNRKDGFEHIRRKVIAIAHYGENAVEVTRNLCGRKPNPQDCDPNSIRYQHGRIRTDGVLENVVHASTNVTEGITELKLWFKPGELREKIVHPRFRVTYSDGYYALLEGMRERLVRATEGILHRGVFYFIVEDSLYFLKDGSLYNASGIRIRASIKNAGDLHKLVTQEPTYSRLDSAKKCGTLVVPSNEQVWASDLRAMQKGTAKGQIDYTVNLAIAKYLVPTESYTASS